MQISFEKKFEVQLMQHVSCDTLEKPIIKGKSI